MKKFLLSLLFALVALVMACGNRAEARVSVSIGIGCPRVYAPCPPPCYLPPCPPRYCVPCPPPSHCHVHRPHLHHVYPAPRHGHHGHHPAPHHAVSRGHAHRR